MYNFASFKARRDHLSVDGRIDGVGPNILIGNSRCAPCISYCNEITRSFFEGLFLLNQSYVTEREKWRACHNGIGSPASRRPPTQ